MPVDLAANARSLGAHVIEVHSRAELEDAVRQARASTHPGPVVIHVQTDPTVHAPDSGSWWDVPVAQVSELESTRAAHAAYLEHKRDQRPLVTPTEPPAAP